MRSVKKVVLASVAVTMGGIGIAAAANSATGAVPASPQIAALSQPAKAPVATEAQRVLGKASFAEVHPQISAAAAVPAPTGGEGSWYLVPTDNGACLAVAGSAVCAPTAAVNSGTLTLIELEMVAGRPDPSRAVINAVAPDGTAKAEIVGADGQVTSTATVKNNVYQLTGSLVAGSHVELIDGRGTTTARFGG